MKRLLLLISLLLLSVYCFSQTVNRNPDNNFKGRATFGTGSDVFTPTDSSAWLQLGENGTTKGMLLPRVSDTGNIANPANGLFIYQTLDSTIYFHNQTRWQQITSNKIDTVQTIPQLEAYNRNPNVNLIYVTDSLRGGLFYYSTIGTPDGGVCFPAVGKITGYWIRVFNQVNGVNVAWFGANPYDAIPDNSNINAAINSPYSNGIVNVNNYTTGQFYLDSAIVLRSNTSFISGVNTRFSLTNDANAYMLVNKNVYTGDSNIVVKGGVWFGNGFNQSRRQNTDSIQYEYAGMILRFVRATNVYVSNVIMDTALSYTTWFPACNNVHVSNSQCWGTATSPISPGHTQNECFVGFSGNGLYLNNLTGHTADDFITIQSGLWGSIDSMQLIPQVNVSNIYADNINIVDLSGAHVWAGFASWAGENAGLPNSNVSNIYLSHFYGVCTSAMFKFGNYPTGISNFNNINISDCNFTVYNGNAIYSNQSVFIGDFNNDSYVCNLNGLYLNNVVENNNGLGARFLQFSDLTNIVGNVTLNNVAAYQTSPTNNPLAYSLVFDASTGSTAAYNLLLNNCKNFDNGLSTSQYLYFRNNVLNTYPVNITFSNCFVNNPSSYPFRCQNAASKMSVNGISLEEPTSYVTAPSEGNVVNDPTAGYSTYLSGKWVQYLTTAVTSFSAGTTGLTPSTATTGAVTMGGVLSVANGGTGSATGETLSTVTGRGNSTNQLIMLNQFNGSSAVGNGGILYFDSTGSNSGFIMQSYNRTNNHYDPITFSSSSINANSSITALSFIKSGGTSSQFLKADGSVDANSYLTGNQTITLSGDITGSGTTSIATMLKNTGTAGNYTRITFDAQGRETSGTDTAYAPSTGGTGYIQNQYAAAQSANWWIGGKTRNDAGTFNVYDLTTGQNFNVNTLFINDSANYTNPAAGMSQYVSNSSVELDNTHNWVLSGEKTQIAGVLGGLTLNGTGTTTWVYNDAGSPLTGLIGESRAFNNSNYGNISSINAYDIYSYTQGGYTTFTGNIDTMAQVELSGNTAASNNINTRIGNHYGILQLSTYPNSYNGGVQMPVRLISTNYTATTSDYTIIVKATLTLTLPTASTVPGQIYHIISIGFATTVSPGFFDYTGALVTSVATSSGVTIQSDGTEWQKIGN